MKEEVGWGGVGWGRGWGVWKITLHQEYTTFPNMQSYVHMMGA